MFIMGVLCTVCDAQVYFKLQEGTIISTNFIYEYYANCGYMTLKHGATRKMKY